MAPCNRLKQRMRPLPVWRISDDIDLSSESSRESIVEFGSVEIREHSRELGVYSDLKNGLALGWEYEQHEPIPIDEYEKENNDNDESCSSTSSTAKRGGGGGDMSPTSTRERLQILAEFGYSREEIKKAEKERIKQVGCPKKNLPNIIRTVQRRVFSMNSPRTDR